LSECGLKNADLLLAKPERGIIIYHWEHWEGPYKRIYIPNKCINRDTVANNNLPIDAVYSLNIDFSEIDEMSDNDINTI